MVAASAASPALDPSTMERAWLGAYPPGVPPTYAVPEVALPRLLDDAARDFPDQPALIVGTRTVSYVEHRDHVDRLATALADAGVGAGDRVLVALPLGEVAATALFALWRLGAVAVPVDPRTPGEPLAAVAADAGVTAALAVSDALERLAAHDVAPALLVAVRGDELVRRSWRSRLPRPRLPRPGRRETGGGGLEGVRHLADVLDGTLPRTAPRPPSPDTPAVLAYRPRARDLRGVVLTHGNLVANAFQGRLWVPDIQAGRERVLVSDPFHLTVPLTLGLLTATLAAAAVVLAPEPDGQDLADAVETHQVTLWPTGPTRLAQLAGAGTRRRDRRDLSSLRVVVTGGAPVDPRVAADVERRTGGARVREGYGLAEAGPLTHAQPVYGRVSSGSIGLPVTGTVAAVVDPDDVSRPLPNGEVGMLVVHGPQVAAGYWKRPEASTATFRAGWLVTGDLARVDDQGVFTLIGRASEVVRRDGELVAPGAVEAVLARHPGVVAVTVVTGDAAEPRPGLAAAVVVTRRSRLDEAKLRAHVAAHLPAAAVPDHVAVVASLPADGSGEVDRDTLRDELLGGTP